MAPNVECGRQNDNLEGQSCDDTEADIDNSPDFHTPSNPTKSNLCTYVMSSSTLKPLLQSMNNRQQKIFYKIRDWCIRYKNGEKDLQPFHLFITGGAGVGKSHLIKCIYGACSKILRSSESPGDISVLLLAPTGTAAHNIHGQTIHSAFKIPVPPGRNYQPLSSDVLNSLRAELDSLKIIILDEVSMVGTRLLEYLDGRLRQIMGKSYSSRAGAFGGVSVVAVGDFYQLAPIPRSPIIVSSLQYGSQLFRDNFKLTELDEVMRQRDDAVFARALNKLRVKSKNTEIDPDIDAMLKTRANIVDVPTRALHVYSKNSFVDEQNLKMVYDICQEIETIKAMDFKKTLNGKLQLLPEATKSDKNSLPDELLLGINARIMLIRNISTTDGLVNGVFGTVVGLEKTRDVIEEVFVKFDDERVGRDLVQQLPSHLPSNCVSIKRIEEPVKENNKKGCVTRRQFPMKLGWAATIHKVQGMSVKQLVVDMKKIWEPGQAYVALSRVTSLSGLFIHNYDPTLIFRDETIHRELATLPRLLIEESDSAKPAAIVVHNVQGLLNKLTDIAVTYGNNAAILCLTETWLSNKSSDIDIAIHGYRVFRQDRSQDNCRGGTAVYIANHIIAQRVNLQNFTNYMEAVMAKVLINGFNVVIVCLYRSPSTKITDSMQQIEGIIQIAEEQPDVDCIILTGDFNENLLTEGSHSLYDYMISQGFTQHVRQATYISGSLLDVVYARGNIDLSALVKPIYFSDHELVNIDLD